MYPTSQFFSKLRKLAVTLESETSRLQNSFENRNNDGDSGELSGHKQTCGAAPSYQPRLLFLLVYINISSSLFQKIKPEGCGRITNWTVKSGI